MVRLSIITKLLCTCNLLEGDTGVPGPYVGHCCHFWCNLFLCVDPYFHLALFASAVSNFLVTFLFLFFLRFYLFLVRGEGEREREGEKHQYVVASCVPPTGGLACNPGIFPERESNLRPFGSQANAQLTELCQPGLLLTFLAIWVCWQ